MLNTNNVVYSCGQDCFYVQSSETITTCTHPCRHSVSWLSNSSVRSNGLLYLVVHIHRGTEVPIEPLGVYSLVT